MKWLGKLNEMWETHIVNKQIREIEKPFARDKKVAEFIMNKYKAPNTKISTDLGMDFDSILTYLSTIKLNKHSSDLTWLTIGLTVLGVGMIVLALQQATLWPFCLW